MEFRFMAMRCTVGARLVNPVLGATVGAIFCSVASQDCPLLVTSGGSATARTHYWRTRAGTLSFYD